MAKNSVADWSTTPDQNTDIGGIDISEGCSPAGINDAIRILMGQGKTKFGTFDSAIAAITASGIATVVKDTQANLFADLAHADGTVAVVLKDADPTKNDLYYKSGASGSGSWSASGIFSAAAAVYAAQAATSAVSAAASESTAAAAAASFSGAFENASGLAPVVVLDVAGRPISTIDSEGNTLDRDGNQPGISDIYTNIAAALASTPGTPEALFNADRLNALAPRHFVRRPIFVWDSLIGISPSNTRCDSARFIDRIPLTSTTGLWTLSPRSAALNDSENEMKLSAIPYSVDGNDIPSASGSLVDIDVPAAFTAGTGDGASWNGGGIVVGSNIFVFFQRLNGSYSVGVKDTYVTRRAVSGGSWTAPRLLLGGTASYAAFGVIGSGAGFTLVGGVNNVNLMGTKVIVPGYLPASPKGYLATLYADQSTMIANPDTFTLTCGTPLQYASTTYNEPAFNVGPNGNGFFFVRDESGNARGVYKTTDGINLTFVRHDTTLAIQNVACGFGYSSDGVPKGLVAGSIDTTPGHRQKAAVYLCYGDDLTPMAVVTDLWDPAERIEYMKISWDSASAKWVFDFEHSSFGTDASFNIRVGESELSVNDAELLSRAVAL